MFLVSITLSWIFGQNPGQSEIQDNMKYSNLSNFNTNYVTNMYRMFYECSSLKKENIIIKDKNSLNKMLEEF